MQNLNLRSYLVPFILVAAGTLAAGACSSSETATTESGGLAGKGGKGGKGGSAGSSAGSSSAGSNTGGTSGGTSAGGSSAGGSSAGSNAGGANAGSSAGGSDAGSNAGGEAGLGGQGGDSGSAGSGEGGSASAGEGGTSSAGVGGSDVDGGVAGTGQAGTGGLDPDSACVAQSAEASLLKKPVDIIFIIDNSGSMTGEIISVQNNINKNFAQIIENSGLDYRVVMISRHGTATSGQSICVSQPLSGANCTCTAPSGPCSNVPAEPVNTAKFFHYSVEIGSTNSLTQAIATYAKLDEHGLATVGGVNGWKVWLRKDALKIFVEITDDNQSGSTADTDFDTKLLAFPEGHFGTAAKRNYVFHSIVGLNEKADITQPYLSTEPLVTEKCDSGAVNVGTTYQKLSILTGGLRFPICNNAGFDVVFKKIAEGVVEGSVIECAFPIPDPPPGESIDPSTIVINYTPGNGGAEESFGQVQDESSCDGKSFFIKDNKINLCPIVCGTVQADTKAKVQLLYGCGKI